MSLKSLRTILNCDVNLEFQCEKNWDLMEKIKEKDDELFEGSLFRKKCTNCNQTVHLVSNIESLRNGALLGYCMLFDPYFESKEIKDAKIRINEIKLKELDLKSRTLGVFKKS